MAYKRKLIEVAIPLAAINAAAETDGPKRKGHPWRLHYWWARRKLVVARLSFSRRSLMILLTVKRNFGATHGTISLTVFPAVVI